MAKKKGSKVRPLGDKVLLQRVEASAKSKGGIVIPDAAREKPREGKVIAVGTGRTLDGGGKAAFQVAIGDRVLFSSYAGTELKHDGEEYVIMAEDDILAVLG